MVIDGLCKRPFDPFLQLVCTLNKQRWIWTKLVSHYVIHRQVFCSWYKKKTLEKKTRINSPLMIYFYRSRMSPGLDVFIPLTRSRKKADFPTKLFMVDFATLLYSVTTSLFATTLSWCLSKKDPMRTSKTYPVWISQISCVFFCNTFAGIFVLAACIVIQIIEFMQWAVKLRHNVCWRRPECSWFLGHFAAVS